MYVRLAGNELKHPIYGLGAMDYLNGVVTGEIQAPVGAGGYHTASDGPEGGKAQFIERTIRDYRRLAQEEIMRRANEFPGFVEYVNRRSEERADRRWPIDPEIMERPRPAQFGGGGVRLPDRPSAPEIIDDPQPLRPSSLGGGLRLPPLR